MNNIEYVIKNNKVIIFLYGKVDSSNAYDIEEKILEKLSSLSFIKLRFDLSFLEYISSAGLRVILTLKNKYKDVAIDNANDQVYDVLDTTGFTSIIKVTKIMREISIEGLTLVGEGSVGKVYQLDEDTIIKVFAKEYGIKEVLKERELAQKAFLFGAPTAISYDVVKIKETGCYGAVFEMIKSVSYCTLFKTHPENVETYLKENIELFKNITSIDVDINKLPNKKDETKIWIKTLKENNAFDEQTMLKIEELISSISEPHKLVHGDLHIKNLFKQNNEVVIIDMETLGYGHQIFELSALYLAYVAYGETDKHNAENFLGISDDLSKTIFYSIFNGAYLDKSQKEKEEILEKCMLFSYINLTYKVLTWEKENLVRYNHAREQVNKLISKFNSLDY